MRKTKRGKESRFNNFVALPRKTLRGIEWKELSPSAKLLYLHLKSKYNGINNGGIVLHYSELKGIRGISSPDTISKAFQELEAKEWISRTNIGGLYRKDNRYKLTGKHDDHLGPY